MARKIKRSKLRRSRAVSPRGRLRARARVKIRRRRLFLARRRRFKRAPIPIRRKPIPPSATKEPPAPPPKPAPAPVPHKPKRQVLLCPGPVNTSPAVHAALGGPDLCHREPEFKDLLQTVRAKLVHSLGMDHRYTAVLFGGSGTAALEAAVMSCRDGAKKMLVINNGVYGSRIAQLARIHEIPLVEIRSPLGERPELSRVAAALKRDAQIQTVAMVHHETSTGMLNPAEEVAGLAKKFRRRFLVDAISSLGAERLDLAKQGVGLCVGSAGKCFHGAPGLSFVLLSAEEAARAAKVKPRSLYLDLGSQLKAQDSGEPAFTPAVPLVNAFHAALDELGREGLPKRIARYRERAVFLRGGFKKLGLKFLLDEKLLSNTLTSLLVPEGKTYAQIHDSLKKAGYVIYAGQSELKGKIIRVAHMGQLLQSDLKGFLKALQGALA